MQNHETNKDNIVPLYTLVIALIPSIIILWFTGGLLADQHAQYVLLSSANANNLESDVVSRLDNPDIIFEDKNNLEVAGYFPVPEAREVDKVVGYKRGKYLMYVFYKDEKVLATFISRKGRKND